MRIDITNGFVEIRDAMNKKAKNAYYDAMFGGVNMKLNPITGQSGETADFPISNMRKAQQALINNLVVRIVIDGETITDTVKYMEEEMTEADYDKVAVACQRLDDPKVEAEKKTKSSPPTAS